MTQNTTGAVGNWIVGNNNILDDQVTPTMDYGIKYLGNPIISVSSNQVSGPTVAAYSSINNGASGTYTSGTQSADIFQTTNFSAYSSASVTHAYWRSGLGPGYFQSFTQAGDAGIFFDINNANSTGGFVIAPRGSVASGIRFAGTTNNISYYGTTHTFIGGVIGASQGINVSTGYTYSYNGAAGFTGTKTAGACVINVQGGIITGISGC